MLSLLSLRRNNWNRKSLKMAIKVTIGKEEQKGIVRLEMDIRKSLNGDLMIFDHGDIDIVLSPSTNKVFAFPKETMNDLVYGAQNRLFTHLHRKGVVVAESIQAGAFCGSLKRHFSNPLKRVLIQLRWP